MPGSQLRHAAKIWRNKGFRYLLRTAFRVKILDPVVDRFWDGEVLTSEEVQQRCSEEGKMWEYDVPGIKEEILSRHDDSDPLFRVREKGYDWSPRKVCELEDAAVIGEHGVVCDSDGNFVAESIKTDQRSPWWSTEKYVRKNPWVRFRAGRRKLLFREPTNLENAMSMVTKVSSHYGHWLFEYLPMLLHISVYEEKTGREPDIIVDPDPPGWMLESLDILGYPEERLVEYDGFTTVERLVLPFSSIFAYSPGCLRISPVEFRWLRERFLEAVDGTDTSANERFYVSRQNFDSRYVTNFDEIKPLLEEFDIEIVRPEELSVGEQVRKFSRAGLVVGPQGSGLHNTIFARDAVVVEIFTPDMRLHSQYLLDHSLGHDYYHMFGSVHGGERPQKRKNFPFQIDPGSLRLMLDQVLSDSPEREMKYDEEV